MMKVKVWARRVWTLELSLVSDYIPYFRFPGYSTGLTRRLSADCSSNPRRSGLISDNRSEWGVRIKVTSGADRRGKVVYTQNAVCTLSCIDQTHRKAMVHPAIFHGY